MATILRVDTPQELLNVDAQLDRPSFRGRMVFSLIMAAAAPIVLLFALVTLNPIGVLVAVGWFFLWTGWLLSIRRKLKGARPYRVPVQAGISQIREAHGIYRRLSEQSSSRSYALPLINTMYRISVVPVQGEYGEHRLVELMQERVDALRKLLAAEDKVSLASAGQWAADRDDLGAVEAWHEALAEVEAKLNFTI
jgi:hypothetical protein